MTAHRRAWAFAYATISTIEISEAIALIEVTIVQFDAANHLQR